MHYKFPSANCVHCLTAATFKCNINIYINDKGVLVSRPHTNKTKLQSFATVLNFLEFLRTQR